MPQQMEHFIKAVRETNGMRSMPKAVPQKQFETGFQLLEYVSTVLDWRLTHDF
jgi:hypothetical protein